MSTTDNAALNTEAIVQDILNSIDREREREIIARRYGLFDRKETLEQIGELLGITRERVRQLEKSVMTRLRTTGAELPHITDTENTLLTAIREALVLFINLLKLALLRRQQIEHVFGRAAEPCAGWSLTGAGACF